MGDSYPNLLKLRDMFYKSSYPNPNRIRIPTSFWSRNRGHYIKSRGVVIENTNHKSTHPKQDACERIRC